MTAPSLPADAVVRARAATRERLLNAAARELELPPGGPGPWRLDLLESGALVAEVTGWSPSGHHRWGEEIVLDTGSYTRPVSHEEFVHLLLTLLDAALPDPCLPDPYRAPTDRVGALGAQIRTSVARTARYLAAPARPEPADAAGRTRHAEQAVRTGHPFHPAPKSIEGVDHEAADRFAPELGVLLPAPPPRRPPRPRRGGAGRARPLDPRRRGGARPRRLARAARPSLADHAPARAAGDVGAARPTGGCGTSAPSGHPSTRRRRCAPSATPRSRPRGSSRCTCGSPTSCAPSRSSTRAARPTRAVWCRPCGRDGRRRGSRC